MDGEHSLPSRVISRNFEIEEFEFEFEIDKCLGGVNMREVQICIKKH